MQIRELTGAELARAAAVVARGMRDNPLHLAAYGEDAALRERTFTRIFVKLLERLAREGCVLGAVDETSEGAIVGVCAMARPGRCQPSAIEKLAFVPLVFAGVPPSSGAAAARWLKQWAELDPPEPHWHLGPVAVDRELHGRGIGTALMREFVRRIDDTRALAYLETDKATNVPFYERFGFRVAREASVIGVPNWFMTREAAVG